MGLSEKDESGRRRPYVLENTEHIIDVDTVIMSLGTSPNPIIAETTEGLEINKWKCIIANEEGKTSKEGVYAGGLFITIIRCFYMVVKQIGTIVLLIWIIRY